MVIPRKLRSGQSESRVYHAAVLTSSIAFGTSSVVPSWNTIVRGASLIRSIFGLAVAREETQRL
jgi:hypothetical protein